MSGTMLRIFAGITALIASVTAGEVSHPVPTGRVSLFSFERGHLRTVTDKINTEVVLTAPPRYFEAYLFECNATFPVQWAYIGEAAPVVTADVGRFFKDFYDINTYTYQTIMLMYSLQEMQSGRYICRGASKEHDKLAIHYDVFVPGNGTQILLSTSEKKLFIPENKEHAYIPCGVSDSTAVVNLYRGNQWGTFYPVPVNGSITFNPRKGFKIRFKDFLDPWGTYLCVSSTNKRRRKVHLVPENLKAKYDLINHVNGKIPVYFSYEYEYNRILCCTGTNFIPKLQWAGCGSILDCQVKSACFEEDRCEQRLGNSGYNPTKWIDPGPLPPGCSGYRLRDDPNGDFGLFKCSTPGIAQYQPYLLNRGNIFLDFEKTPPSEMILTLQRISPEGPSFVGDEVEFHCNSTRFYFAYGIRWGFEKLMGEIEFIDDATVIRDKYSVRGHRRRTTFRIPHSDIKAIICFVPVVNSATEWRTVSLPLVIAASDVNYIQHQNPINPANNVIDLDSITYQTDYDTPALDPNNNQGHIQQPQIVLLQNHQQPAPHQSPPEPQQQLNVIVDAGKYNTVKEPVQQFQVVPTEHIETNPYYNYYTHDSSVEQPHPPQQQVIISTHPQSSIPQNSHSVHPLVQPQTVDAYTSAAALTQTQASSLTTSPDIISISRSKKTRSRTSSSSVAKPAPISKPSSDAHYDALVDNPPPVYDTYEPSPSSSENSKLHHGTKPHSTAHKIRTSSTRIPQHQTYSSTVVGSKRPSSSSPSHRTRNNNNIYLDEILYSSPKKSYRDYNNFNDHHGFTDNMRLSLPFEPSMPNMGRGRYAHGTNHSVANTHVREIPIRTTSSVSSSRTHSRSNSRRPSTSVPAHHHQHSRHHHPQQHQHQSQKQQVHASHEEEKDYAIDDSYNQHVRHRVPTKSDVTQLPKLQKPTRNHHPGQGHSKSSVNNDHHRNANGNVDYYYYTDDSPVEIKVPRMKAHESHSSRSHHHPHQQQQFHHQRQSHRHSSASLINKDVHVIDPDLEPELYLSSPTTYLKRRPSAADFFVRPTSQSYLSEGAVEHSSTSNGNAKTNPHHQPQHHHQHRPQSQTHHHTTSSSRSQNHGKNHQIQFISKSSGRRPHSRAFKFNADTLPNGKVVAEAYELKSPTARPAYYVSVPHHHHSPNHHHSHSTEDKNDSQFQNSNEYIKTAQMELKRVEPHQRAHASRPGTKPTNNNNNKNNSSEILHSVSISISSKITHSHEDPEAAAAADVDHQISPLSEHEAQVLDDSQKSIEGEEVDEDYDIYSPRYNNYRKSTTPPSVSLNQKSVPIHLFQVKPHEMSSFMPAKSIIDEEDEDELPIRKRSTKVSSSQPK